MAAAANPCVFCGGFISSAADDPASHGMVVCASIPEHRSAVHLDCLTRYVKEASDIVTKTKKLQALLPKLRGGGASTKLVSNSLQKKLGLVKTWGYGKEDDLSNLTQKAAKSYMAWAASSDLKMRLLVAPCPVPDCGITLEEWRPADGSGGNGAGGARKGSQIVFSGGGAGGGGVVDELDDDEDDEDDDEERCTGVLMSTGARCRRLFTGEGGDAERMLCRKCVAAEAEREAKAREMIMEQE